MTPLLRWAPPVVWTGVLLFLGTRSPGDLPSGPAGFDKLAHLGFYAVLGALVARAGGHRTACVLAGLVLGATDEWLQSSVPGRTAEWLDLAADVVGENNASPRFSLLCLIHLLPCNALSAGRSGHYMEFP